MKKQKKIKSYKNFYNNLNIYLNTFIIPDVIAYYLASSYYEKALGKYHLNNYLNSAKDIFNTNCEIDIILPKVKEILLIKYHLIIKEINPLVINRIND